MRLNSRRTSACSLTYYCCTPTYTHVDRCSPRWFFAGWMCTVVLCVVLCPAPGRSAVCVAFVSASVPSETRVYISYHTALIDSFVTDGLLGCVSVRLHPPVSSCVTESNPDDPEHDAKVRDWGGGSRTRAMRQFVILPSCPRCSHPLLLSSLMLVMVLAFELFRLKLFHWNCLLYLGRCNYLSRWCRTTSGGESAHLVQRGRGKSPAAMLWNYFLFCRGALCDRQDALKSTLGGMACVPCGRDFMRRAWNICTDYLKKNEDER